MSNLIGTCTSTAGVARVSSAASCQNHACSPAVTAVWRNASHDLRLPNLMPGFCHRHWKSAAGIWVLAYHCVPGGSVDAVRFRATFPTACLACLQACQLDLQQMLLDPKVNCATIVHARFTYTSCTVDNRHPQPLDQRWSVHQLQANYMSTRRQLLHSHQG